jgi:rhamnosyltransferase
MFTSISVLDDVGDMADDLFIDLVDLEWCWRAKKIGYQIYMSGTAILPHQIGVSVKKVMNRSFLVAAPIRHYYVYRNVLWLCKLDYMPKLQKRKRLKCLIFFFFLYPWLTDQPFKTFSYMVKGTFDGLFGRLKQKEESA